MKSVSENIRAATEPGLIRFCDLYLNDFNEELKRRILGMNMPATYNNVTLHTLMALGHFRTE